MIDLLVVLPCELEVINDLNLVTNYPEMKCHFVMNEILKLDYPKRIVFASAPTMWTNKSKHKYDEFVSVLREQKISISKVNHILFAGLKALNQFRPTHKGKAQGSLEKLKRNVKGNIYKWEDKNFRRMGDQVYTIGHYTNTKWNTKNYFSAGLTIADIFKPRHDWENTAFRVHIDHTLPDRWNTFDEIKEILYKLESKIEKHSFWNSLHVFYHDKITPIEEIGHNDYGKISINELADIYGQTHVAFVSHRETLGQYPLELLASGATVVSSWRNIPYDHKELYKLEILEEGLNLDKLLDIEYLKLNCQENSKIIEKFGFDKFTKNMLDFIFSDPELEDDSDLK